jgi:hypothetical protein
MNPILRTVILTLIATGLAGAMLFFLQSPRTRPVDLTVAPSHSPHRAHATHRSEPRSTEQDAAKFMAAAPGASAARFIPARAAAPGSQLQSDPADDLDLNDPALRVPLARLALSAVGMDELAEALWLHAINDPELDAEVRQNLIEDLNEEGFADPKNLTRDELPLIEARLALIDRLAPEAMDETNAAAFEEARKDLVEMRAKLLPATAAPEPGAPAAPAPIEKP